MENHKVEFERIEWISAGDGIRYKCFEKGKQKIRLMDLNDMYSDTDWCQNGHAAYILDGRFTVKFEDHTETFNAGDTVFISAGMKHIAMVENGYHLKMISFEI